jgi:hypothetical protein
MGKWLAAFSNNTQDTREHSTDITDSKHIKHVTSVLSVLDESVETEKTETDDRWNPEYAKQGYVWCLDCLHFDNVNCNHSDNPFRTITKCPQAPRKCQWHEKADLNKEILI